ncbi:MAG: GHKL domain-containing protein [Lachnospiraceae bacterium]|nr:GHKL domain-containing protein [Lachnospiraceae bacterium]
MMDFLCPTLELMIFLPGMLLAYLPMKHYLRLHPVKLAAITALLTLFLCLTGGAVSCFFHISALWLFFPIAIVMGSFYVYTLKITRWKSISVFLAVCGAFSCIGNAAIGMSGILSPGVSAPPLPFRAVLFWFVMCCVLVAASWHPATHAARNLLEDDAFAQTWYVFWLLPPLFIVLNLTIIPKDPSIMEQGRLRQLYILFSFVFLFLLLLSYMLFYLMAASLNRNDRLRRENQFLSMQQARYDNLRSTIGQIRQARHDMRHHLHVLQSLAAQGNLESITKYLYEAQSSIPAEDLGLCKNAAVDSVASYFAPLCRENGIPLAFELDLPRELPVSEPDLCSVLSNLLENAMDASLKTASERRQVKVSARLHSDHMVLLSVENTYDGKIKEKDGVFLSSKRPGEGIGLQAVRHIAEKNGGYCRFIYGDGVFCVNVILRGVT